MNRGRESSCKSFLNQVCSFRKKLNQVNRSLIIEEEVFRHLCIHMDVGGDMVSMNKYNIGTCLVERTINLHGSFKLGRIVMLMNCFVTIS